MNLKGLNQTSLDIVEFNNSIFKQVNRNVCGPTRIPAGLCGPGLDIDNLAHCLKRPDPPRPKIKSPLQGGLYGRDQPVWHLY